MWKSKNKLLLNNDCCETGIDCEKIAKFFQILFIFIYFDKKKSCLVNMMSLD